MKKSDLFTGVIIGFLATLFIIFGVDLLFNRSTNTTYLEGKGISQEVATAYQKAGVTEEVDVVLIQEAGITPERIAPYVKKGLCNLDGKVNCYHTVLKCVKENIPAEKVLAYHQAGIKNCYDIVDFVNDNADPQKVAKYFKAGIKSNYEIVRFIENGVSPQKVITYQNAGIKNSHSIISLSKTKIPVDKIMEYYQAGIKDGCNIKNFVEADITPAVAAEYCKAGICERYDIELLNKHQVDPKTYTAYKQAGITDLHTIAFSTSLHKLNPEQLASYKEVCSDLSCLSSISDCIKDKIPPKTVIAYQKAGIKHCFNMRDALEEGISPERAASLIGKGCKEIDLGIEDNCK